MIKLENYEVVGWEHAIRGMRNPMNSWEKSDTGWAPFSDTRTPIDYDNEWGTIKVIGDNDLDLMTRLRNAGTDHRKFMRMIAVYVDITAPLYWWKEFDTYQVGVTKNSCSTMHKIHEKEFTLEDFSIERVMTDPLRFISRKTQDMCIPSRIFEMWLHTLNMARDAYIETKDKRYWDTMIQMLPSSYNQKRTVMLNYEVLANIYHARKNHKLTEWLELCKWIEGLPYSELITGEEK